MLNTAATVALVPLKSVPEGERTRLLAGIAALELAPGQDAFVGEPAAMTELALADPQRHPFAIVTGPDVAGPDVAGPVAAYPVDARSEGAVPDVAVVGMGVLHLGAAGNAGWPADDTAVLLRGFLIGQQFQGRGYGAAATVAAVELARELAGKLAEPAEGVVLGVNERNLAGRRAYANAGFVPHGRYLGGRSGPQQIMYKAF